VAQTYDHWEIRAKTTKGAGLWPNLRRWPTAGKQGTKIGKGDG
jgi:hypothetical protein